MHVNLQKLEEIGMSESDVPKKWDELYDSIYKMKDAGGGLGDKMKDAGGGLKDKLELGNMDSYRDWGHSMDYVRAMHMIINHKNPWPQ